MTADLSELMLLKLTQNLQAILKFVRHFLQTATQSSQNEQLQLLPKTPTLLPQSTEHFSNRKTGFLSALLW